MPTTSRPRRSVLRGTTALVSHAYPPYIHQVTPSINRTRTSDTSVVWLARTPVSCVMMKTKTRSKNSSTVLTRTAVSARFDHSVAGLPADAPDAFAASPAADPPRSGSVMRCSVTAATDEQRRSTLRHLTSDRRYASPASLCVFRCL